MFDRRSGPHYLFRESRHISRPDLVEIRDLSRDLLLIKGRRQSSTFAGSVRGDVRWCLLHIERVNSRKIAVSVECLRSARGQRLVGEAVK